MLAGCKIPPPSEVVHEGNVTSLKMYLKRFRTSILTKFGYRLVKYADTFVAVSALKPPCSRT